MKPLRVLTLVAVGAAVVAFAGVGRPESAGSAEKPAGGITVTGVGTVASVPDEASFTIGVHTQGSTAREALSANSEQMRRVIDAVKSAGVEKSDIKTQDVSVSADYAEEGRIDGYSARNSVLVTIRGLSKAGAILDAASNAGANEVYGPMLSRSDEDAQQAEALRDAVSNARKKAETLADAAGVRLGGVTSIREGFSGGPEPYYDTGARLMKDEAAPIEPGTQDTQATVTVTFAIGG
jgi:uncharacterized protein YggE